VFQTPAPERKLADVRRIAVLRANALGDYVMTIPAIEALRATYPGAEIILLGTPLHVELLAGRPGPVDRVEVIPVMDGLWKPAGTDEDPAAVAEFFDRMRTE
jgi:ADP-heptose:LPS heptosyltransferase